MPTTTPRPCRCDGRYQGCDHGNDSCPNPANTPRSQYWCEGCDERRCDHITQNLEVIKTELDARSGVTP